MFTKNLSKSYKKIKEIDLKFNIFKKKCSVIEFGSNKSGWTQYILKKSKNILCIDKKIINKIICSSIKYIEIDMFNIFNILNFKKKFNVVVSDVCHNISGIKDLDSFEFIKIFNFFYLNIDKILLKKGNFIFKYFNKLITKKKIIKIKKYFKTVKNIKLKTSKKKSSEFFLICKKFK
ncbi:SAM-dependent methyltransferase [Candidatus Vidania fulgoroideorum]